MIGWGICQVLPDWRRAFVCKSAVCKKCRVHTAIFARPRLTGWMAFLVNFRPRGVDRRDEDSLCPASLVISLLADGRYVRSPPIVCLPHRGRWWERRFDSSGSLYTTG